MAGTLKLARRGRAWWITGAPAGVHDMGPYDTRAEADDDRRGVERFLRRQEKGLGGR